MSDDLVKRLLEYRPTYGWPEEQSAIKRQTLAEEAAARIDELEAKVRETALQFLSVESRDEALCARIAALEEGLRKMRAIYVQHGDGDAVTLIAAEIDALLGGRNCE